MTDWLNDDLNECWTFYRQSSGIYSIQKLDSGDLDMALLGSTPYAASAARRGALQAVAMAHIKGSAEALITREEFTEPKQLERNVEGDDRGAEDQHDALRRARGHRERRHGPDGREPRVHVAG